MHDVLAVYTRPTLKVHSIERAMGRSVGRSMDT